jgi:uncharacterized protein
MTRRLVLWSGLDAWRAEAVTVDLTAAGLSAAGSQLGVDPLPYRLDYALTTYPDLATRSLEVRVTGDGWTRRLRLDHDGDGDWRCDAGKDGEAPLPDAGGDAAAVRGALDCDLARSPLTNTMPVRRGGLAERPGAADFLMAFVSVPDLGLHPSRQRYEHVRRGPHGAVVRYVDRGLFPGFTAELELDGDGLAVLYPELARRAG